MRTLGFDQTFDKNSIAMQIKTSRVRRDSSIEILPLRGSARRVGPFSDARKIAAEPRGSYSAVRVFLVLALLLLSGSVAIAQTTAPSTSTTVIDSRAVPRTRQAATGNEDHGVNWKTLTMAMFVVLGLIVALKYAAMWLFPGVRAGVAGRGVRVLARTAIAPRQQVLLLHVGRRILVVGDSGGSLNPLANIDEPDEVAELLGQISSTTTATASSKFRAMFGRAERDYDPAPESLTAADDLSNPQRDQPPTEANIAAAQNEISGLVERMRNLSQQVKK